MTATVYIHKTGTEGTLPVRDYTPLTFYLSRLPERNKLIASKVVEDVQDGQTVLIPVRYLEQAGVLYDLIREKLGPDSCLIINAGQSANDRNVSLNSIREGRVPVAIVTTAVLGSGFDLRSSKSNEPIWTRYYKLFPGPDRFLSFRHGCVRIFIDIECPLLVSNLKPTVRQYLNLGYSLDLLAMQDPEVSATLSDLTGEHS